MAEESSVRVMEEETTVELSTKAETVEETGGEPAMQTEAVEAPVVPEETGGEPAMQSEVVETPAVPEETRGEPAMQTEVVEAPVVPEEATSEPAVQTEAAEEATGEPAVQTEAAEAPMAPQEATGEPAVQTEAAEAPMAPQEVGGERSMQCDATEAPMAPQEMSGEAAMLTEAAEAPVSAQEMSGEAVEQDTKPAVGEVAEATAVAAATTPQNDARDTSAMEVDTPVHVIAEANTPPKNSTDMEEDTPEKGEAPPGAIGTVVQPLTPLFQFLQDHRQNIMQEFGVKKITEVAKMAKELFDALAPEERKAYEDDYEKKKKAYQAWLAVQEGQQTLAAAKARRAALAKSKRAHRAAGKPRSRAASEAPSATAAGKAAPAKPAAMKKRLAKAKPRSRAAQSMNKAVRPTRPVLQYMKDNRYKIMTQHKLRRATELPKKAAELWNMLPWEQRKPYVDRYNEQKKAWLQFKASERTAIKQYERTLGTKAPAEKSKKRSAASSSRPATSSKARKTAASRSAGAKAPEPQVILSFEAMEKAKRMGTAASGLPYLRLLEKLLSTPGLGDVSEEDALCALKRSKGIVNVARNELKSNVIEV